MLVKNLFQICEQALYDTLQPGVWLTAEVYCKDTLFANEPSCKYAVKSQLYR